MKRNSDFILRKVAGEYVLVSTGKSLAKFSGVITINEQTASLWKLLEKDSTLEELIKGITDEYEVSEEEARTDIIKMLTQFKLLGMLEEA